MACLVERVVFETASYGYRDSVPAVQQNHGRHFAFCNVAYYKLVSGDVGILDEIDNVQNSACHFQITKRVRWFVF